MYLQRAYGKSTYSSALDQSDNMKCVSFPEVWLSLLLLLHLVYSEKPEPLFGAKGNNVEMGYCFGADYIIVYRSSRDGLQLLGNSSNKNMPNVPPQDLQGRISITEDQHLLGLQIRNLTHMDSGLYWRECWQNQSLVSRQTQQLSVCNEGIEYEVIILKIEGGWADVLCNSSSVNLEGTSVRWYFAMHPNYTTTLVLDSSVSSEPLVEELSGVVEVRDRGSRLRLSGNSPILIEYFTCVVIKGTDCLSFQNMYTADEHENTEVFVSQGDRVVLYCPAEGKNQQWETPLGKITDSNMRNENIYTSSESGGFSLVIPVVSDEHIGDYSCTSSSVKIQYSVALCSKRETKEKVVYEGANTSLECISSLNNSQRVQWYRRVPSGPSELIHDTKDGTVGIPEDLRGRLTLSENGSSMTISNMKKNDGREYWCVVLNYVDTVDSAGDYNDEYDGEDSETVEYDEDYWPGTEKCLLKQVIMLNIANVDPKTFSTVIPTMPTPSDASNATAVAVCSVLVGLLLVGAIAAWIVVKKKKAKASRTQRVSNSRLSEKADIQLHGDPGCTDRLTNNDDFA